MTGAGPEAASAFARAVGAVRAGGDPEQAARSLLADLSTAERLGMLDGDEPFWPGIAHMMGTGYNLEPIVAGAVARLGIPGIRFSDGPRGAVIGRSTAFPVPMARGATWDPALEERVGDAIGAEIRAQGGNFFGGVCVNLLRHPAWGRAQETYGEETVLLARMGSALARGAQRHVMACVKHFACNSMENARFSVDVRVDERTLHEIYLPHFRAVLDAGAVGVMSAYNSVNGQWCGQSRALLTDVLRDEWGFDGFVVSDFIWGIRDPVGSLRAGLDVEMPFAQQRAAALPEALAAGDISAEDVDRPVLRLLRAQLRFAAERSDDVPGPEVVACASHRALAREVAARSMVLLRNEPVGGRAVLPLTAGRTRRIALLGRLADVPNTGDHGSSDVRAPYVVTPLDGLRQALPDAVIDRVAGDDLAASAAAARAADVALVVVGYDAEDEGEYVGSFDPALAALYPPPEDPGAYAELARLWDAGPQSVGGDRDSLRLHRHDEQLIRAVAAANPRTVVVVLAGAAVTMDWRADVPAVLLAWYPGMEGGSALADVLLGDREPGGRLPFAVPESAADLAPFDRTASAVTYDRLHGQRRLDHNGTAAAFPLGFGLSYTSFLLADVSVQLVDRTVLVRARVANTGSRPGGQVVQVYCRRPDADGGERFLAGFERVEVRAGESAPVQVDVPLERVARRAGPGEWVVTPGSYRFDVATSADDPAAVSLPLELA